MESKRVAMLMTMMMVMVMVIGKLEAEKIPFQECYPVCVVECKAESGFFSGFMCPVKCIKTCLQQPSFSSTKIDDSDYFCKLGCATHHCVSLSYLHNQNVEKVSACVDSCSNKCTKKN